MRTEFLIRNDKIRPLIRKRLFQLLKKNAPGPGYQKQVFHRSPLQISRPMNGIRSITISRTLRHKAVDTSWRYSCDSEGSSQELNPHLLDRCSETTDHLPEEHEFHPIFHAPFLKPAVTNDSKLIPRMPRPCIQRLRVSLRV